MSLLPQLHRHPWMDEGIEAFREQAKRYIAKELVPHLDDWRRQGFIPREVWRPFGELGFLLPEMPEAYGGAGANLAYQLVVPMNSPAPKCPELACTPSPRTTSWTTAPRSKSSAGCHGWPAGRCWPALR
jgi:hypothetical protein